MKNKLLSKQIELNKAKLRNTIIEEFKDELKHLKNILNKIKELKLSREHEIYERKKETKRELNMLHNKRSNILEELVNLCHQESKLKNSILIMKA